jgi:hypothetical protein
MREARKVGDVEVIDAGSLAWLCRRCRAVWRISHFRTADSPQLLARIQALDPALEVATEKLPLPLHLPFSIATRR